jgi:enamine deaminase RidA (YjgF/YER057c/UK114 family)
MESALGLVGMDFSNVFRTWFYLDDILEWYDQFNAVRNQFFKEHSVYDGLVPASTGVGGSNSSGTAVVADLLAIQPKLPTVRLQAVPSPLQCPALQYGSSFSRAVQLELPKQRRLYVSGTASIAPDGQTCHVGDVRRQVGLTMDVVAAILNSRQLGWEDVTRVIGYFKHTEDAPEFNRYCRERRLPEMPVIIAKNDICRDDLLFEIEADAVRLL